MPRASFVAILVTAILVSNTARAQATWSTPETAVAANAGAMSALVMSGSNVANVAYFTNQDDTLYVSYARRSGGVWTSDAPIVARGLNNPLGISVKVNGSGDPSIAYFDFSNFDANYVAKTGGTWGEAEHIATSPGAIGEYAHLALNATGTPLASYANATALFYASKESGSWVSEQIAPKGIPAFLRLDGTGRPVIAFVDSGEVALKTATFNGATWDIDTAVADFTGASAPSVSMAIHNGNISISYRDPDGVKLVTRTDGVWNAPETVVAAADSIATGTTSIGVDFNGDTYIAFATTGGAVKVADDTSGSWFVNTLAANNAGYFLAQGEALSISGHSVGVIFNNTSNNNIMFSTAVIIPEVDELAWSVGALGFLATLAKRRFGSKPVKKSA